ncbi:hypothetical protein BH09ACT12_BH09ACT12_22400 [soil metagenome]
MATKTSKLGVGVALLAAVLGIGVYAGVRFLFFGLDEATPWDKPATLVGGGAATSVELTYDGRACRDRVDVAVDEDATTVVITVTETVRTLVCGGEDDPTSYDVVVDLGAPLGDRDLVDGACLLGQFGQDPLCADDVVTVSR